MMKTQTKVFLLVLALMTVVSLCLSVSAASSANLTVTVEGDLLPGETITATVSVSGGTAVKSIMIIPVYDDSVLEMVSGEWLLSELLTEDWSAKEGNAVLAFNDPTVIDGDIFLMTFTVKEDVAINTECKISCDVVIKVEDANGAEIDFETISVTPAYPAVACPHADTTNVAGQEPTCTSTGYTDGVYCNDCGKYISGHDELSEKSHSYTVLQKNETQHWYKCATCTATTIPADHTWNEGVVTKDPTYTEEGVKTYTCTLEGCGQTKTEPITVVIPLYGDVNKDGKVNSMDRTFLARYITQWTGYNEENVDIFAADVNCDGKVNSMDRTILARHITQWEGYETLPFGVN